VLLPKRRKRADQGWQRRFDEPIELPDGRTIAQPHIEWWMHQNRWRWLLDSWEGGEAYRLATYGFDVKGQPIRNMIRHKREYPLPGEQTYSIQVGRPAGTDPANQATDDDYELRRARTPVPGFVGVDPRREVFGAEIRECQKKIRQVTFGIDDDRRNPVDRRLLEQADAEAGFATAGHSDANGVGYEILRFVEKVAAVVFVLTEVEDAELFVILHFSYYGSREKRRRLTPDT